MGKKTFFVIVIAAVIILCGALLLNQQSDIDRLEVSGLTRVLKPGDEVQLQVKGYYEDGTELSTEDMAELKFEWGYSCKGTDFFVDERGVLTAVHEGLGNVWAKIPGEDWTSRPITVYIEE